MNARLAILDRMHSICREMDLGDMGDVRWEDGQFIRSSCYLVWARSRARLRPLVRIAYG